MSVASEAANIHSCSRSPPTPIGCSTLTSGPVTKPSSDVLMCTRTVPMMLRGAMLRGATMAVPHSTQQITPELVHSSFAQVIHAHGRIPCLGPHSSSTHGWMFSGIKPVRFTGPSSARRTPELAARSGHPRDRRPFGGRARASTMCHEIPCLVDVVQTILACTTTAEAPQLRIGTGTRRSQ